MDSNKSTTIGNLRVVITPDAEFWYAQGIEIDYGAQGNTIEEARENFVRGLVGTFELYRKRDGNNHGAFKHHNKVPPQYLLRLIKGFDNREKVENKDIHPFEGFDYYTINEEIDPAYPE